MYVIDTEDTRIAVEPIDRFAGVAPDGQYGVYQLFGATGQLLYVGRSAHLENRLAQHRATKDWWPLVEFGQWTPVDNYAEAVALERASIEADGAIFNVASTAEINPGLVTVPDDVADELRSMYADTSREGSARLNSYMRALHNAGWTLASIGLPIGITRERVRQRAIGALEDRSLSVPTYVRPDRTPQRKVWATLTDDEVSRLRELHALATRCRGTHDVDHPFRKAGDSLTEVIVEAKMRGVRNGEIADAMGVTIGAVTMRLKSRGYLAKAPSMPGYGTRGVLNGEPLRSTRCHQGHELAGDNLRLINGDEARRVCRECERERVRKYRERLAERSA